MATPKQIFYKWTKAPLGYWFTGFRSKKLGHIWEGADGFWRGYTFGRDDSEESVAVGPFKDEAEAKMHFEAWANAQEKR